jgi:oligosaccharyltransferase complex subunit beta
MMLLCLQAFLALTASPTGYSGKPGAAQTDAKLAGSALGLVALAQQRNNARVAVAGSIHMFSNEAFGAQATGRAGERCGRSRTSRLLNLGWCPVLCAWPSSRPRQRMPRCSPALCAACSRGAVANRALCEAVSKWAFQERGVLRASGLSHRVVSGAEPGAVRPERYRINDEVEFSVDIQECSDGACGAYK